MAIAESKKNIPNGSNYVRMIDKGYLYIEIEDRVIKVKDTIGNVKDYVYLRQINGEYQISLTPFVENKVVEEKKEIPKKRNTKTKKNA